MPIDHRTRPTTRSQTSTSRLEVEKPRQSTMLVRASIQPASETDASSNGQSQRSTSLSSSLGALSLEKHGSMESTEVEAGSINHAIVAVNNGQVLTNTRTRTRSRTSGSTTSTNSSRSDSSTSMDAKQQNKKMESTVSHANGDSWLQSSLHEFLSPASEAVSLKQEPLVKSKKGRRKPDPLGTSSKNTGKNGTKARTKRSRSKRAANEESRRTTPENGDTKIEKPSDISTTKPGSKRKRSPSCNYHSPTSSSPSDSDPNVTFIPLALELPEPPVLPTVEPELPQLPRTLTEALTEPTLPGPDASEDEWVVSQAELTWQDDEITGFEADPDDPDDQLGLDGIGFKREGAQEAAVIAKRKQQLLDYERREQAEDRERRLQRRRERGNGQRKKAGPKFADQRDDDDTESEGRRKRVKFADEASTPA